MTRMRRNERGIVAVVVAIALLVLLLMAGFAIDIGHLALNKSRLQSTVDAAALAAAKVLDDTGSTAAADTAARATFDLNAAEHKELRDVLSGGDIIVQFSNTLNPFAPGTTPPEYVRVVARHFSMWTSFTVLIGFDEMNTRASAVAGPSAPITNPCDLFPVAVCADMTKGPPFWGYVPYGEDGNTVTILKLASPAAGTTFGPGNFQLIRLGGTGANVVRENMAGGAACVPPGSMATVDPEPGNVVGAVAQGINTRFGQYVGALGRGRAQYPPDVITTPSPNTPLSSPDGTTVMYGSTPITGPSGVGISGVGYSRVNYLADLEANPPNYTNPPPDPNGGGGDGRFDRRVVTIPIVDCSNPVGGTSGTLPVKGFGAFFLLQPVVHGGGNDGWIFAQFLGEGEVSGAPGPTGGIGPYKIVLHNDPDSPDS